MGKPDSTLKAIFPVAASTCSRWPATSASTCREPLGEPRRFSRRVPTSRRALESRPQEFDSCLLTSATHTGSLPDFSSCPLATLACSFERRRGRPGETQPRRRQLLRTGSLQDLDFFQNFK